jgi:S1-C subfamily serine protease
LTDLNPDLARYFGVDVGVLVTEVAFGSPAEEAGLRSGEVIVRVNDQAVTRVDEVRRAVAEWDYSLAFGDTDRRNGPQEPIVIGIMRDSEPTEIELSQGSTLCAGLWLTGAEGMDAESSTRQNVRLSELTPRAWR